jgi:hypothetical protein
MQRRLVLFTACLWLVIGGTPTSTYGRGLIDSLIHRFLPAHHKTSSRHSSASAGQVVWSGLVMADNAEKPQSIPSEIAHIEPTLKELFGYNQFAVIGQSKKTLKSGQEDLLVSSKHFALKVDARGPSEGGYVVNLKLVQHDDTEPPSDQLVLETDTKLSKRSPLVIKGPQIGNGQLLLVLVIQE